MSVIYNGIRYKVKKKKGLLTLNLSWKDIECFRDKIKNISEIIGLKSLTELQVLNLNNNSISKIEGLETLNNLEKLYLENNKILEIKGLDSLTKLRELNLINNKISQIENFVNKDHLHNLFLRGNPIYNQLKHIPGNSNIERLEIYNRMSNKEIEEAVEEGMTKNGLVLYHEREYKARMKNSLLTLDLSSLEIKDISEIKGLENLTKLQALNLNNNHISEINGLETLINLEILLLENNPIVTLKGLDNLGNLKTLNLYLCGVYQIESFKNKDYLKHIILSKNNPLYGNLKFAISKKKKLSLMTEEERKNAGVNSTVWETAINFRGKILSQPQKKSSAGGLGGEIVVGSCGFCFECLTVVVFLVTLVPLTWLK